MRQRFHAYTKKARLGDGVDVFLFSDGVWMMLGQCSPEPTVISSREETPMVRVSHEVSDDLASALYTLATVLSRDLM